MHNTIQVIAAQEKDRLVLQSVFRNLGADAVFSQDLNDALSVFEKARPRAAFIVDGGDPPAEVMIREIARVAPFMPVVVLLRRRDASKAVAYMKTGAFDCAQSPWTEEELRPVYKKALSLCGTALRLDTGRFEKRRALLVLAGMFFSLLFGFASGWFYGFNTYRAEVLEPGAADLPYSHPSGLAFDGERLAVADWYSQALYFHDAGNLKLARVTALPSTMPAGLASGPNAFWVATAGGTVEKRLNDEKLTLVSRTKPGAAAPAGVCFDGLYLWLAWQKEGRISKRMANDEMTELKSFRFPGLDITAFSCDKRFLWAADGKQRALLKLSVDDPETVLSKTEIKQYASRSFKVTALAPRDGKIWFAAEDGGKARIFSIKEP